jgi:hypothetical protein
MLCDQVREHLSAYLDRELTADLSAAVRAHLDACAECRALADDLRATVDLLGRLPARPAPGHVADDVMREIERRGILAVGAAVEPPPQERTLPMRRARLWPRALAVAATFALAIGIGIFAYLSEVGLTKAPAPASGVAEKAAEKWKEEGRDLSVAMAPKSAEFSEHANGRRMARTAGASASARTDADSSAGWAMTAQADKSAPLPAGTDERVVVPGHDLGERMLDAVGKQQVQSGVLAKAGSGTLTLANASTDGTLDLYGVPRGGPWLQLRRSARPTPGRQRHDIRHHEPYRLQHLHGRHHRQRRHAAGGERQRRTHPGPRGVHDASDRRAVCRHAHHVFWGAARGAGQRQPRSRRRNNHPRRRASQVRDGDEIRSDVHRRPHHAARNGAGSAPCDGCACG